MLRENLCASKNTTFDSSSPHNVMNHLRNTACAAVRPSNDAFWQSYGVVVVLIVAVVFPPFADLEALCLEPVVSYPNICPTSGPRPTSFTHPSL